MIPDSLEIHPPDEPLNVYAPPALGVNRMLRHRAQYQTI